MITRQSIISITLAIFGIFLALLILTRIDNIKNVGDDSDSETNRLHSEIDELKSDIEEMRLKTDILESDLDRLK